MIKMCVRCHAWEKEIGSNKEDEKSKALLKDRFQFPEEKEKYLLESFFA